MGKLGTAGDGISWIFKKVFGKTDDAAALKKSGISKWDELSQTPSFLDDYTLIAVRTTDDAATARKLGDTRATKVAKAQDVADKAKTLPILGTWQNSLVISGVVIFGYATWKSMSVIGVLSEAMEDNINNFFGINCGDGDTTCQEKGAKNMLLTGLLVTAGFAGLVVLSLKKDSQEPVAES